MFWFLLASSKRLIFWGTSIKAFPLTPLEGTDVIHETHSFLSLYELSLTPFCEICVICEKFKFRLMMTLMMKMIIKCSRMSFTNPLVSIWNYKRDMSSSYILMKNSLTHMQLMNSWGYINNGKILLIYLMLTLVALKQSHYVMSMYV
jgi:hypothetical protein